MGEKFGTKTDLIMVGILVLIAGSLIEVVFAPVVNYNVVWISDIEPAIECAKNIPPAKDYYNNGFFDGVNACEKGYWRAKTRGFCEDRGDIWHPEDDSCEENILPFYEPSPESVPCAEPIVGECFGGYADIVYDMDCDGVPETSVLSNCFISEQALPSIYSEPCEWEPAGDGCNKCCGNTCTLMGCISGKDLKDFNIFESSKSGVPAVNGDGEG